MWFQSVTADRLCGAETRPALSKATAKQAGYDSPAAFFADPSAMSFDFNLFNCSMYSAILAGSLVWSIWYASFLCASECLIASHKQTTASTETFHTIVAYPISEGAC